MEITIKSQTFDRVMRKLQVWAGKHSHKELDDAAVEITKTYKAQIKAGKRGDNSSMINVKDSTMEMPVRFTSAPVLRKNVRSSKKPLVARGHAVGSLKKKGTKDRKVIEPSTRHGRIVFGYNAEDGKAKVKRDPLIVSAVQEKIILKHIMKGIDNAIRG